MGVIPIATKILIFKLALKKQQCDYDWLVLATPTSFSTSRLPRRRMGTVLPFATIGFFHLIL